MNKLIPLMIFILMSLVMVPKGAASILSVGDPVFGPDSITRDTESGLEWLDLTLTTNRSYNDLLGIDGSNEFLPGGDFSGFCYATREELIAFWTNSGIVNIPDGLLVENKIPVERLQSLIGITESDSPFEFFRTVGVYGYLQVLSNGDVIPFAAEIYIDGGRGDAELNLGTYYTSTNEHLGHWLVRDASQVIPEPATLALFGLSLLGLFLRKKFIM
jgi:hypothetical protein